MANRGKEYKGGKVSKQVSRKAEGTIRKKD